MNKKLLSLMLVTLCTVVVHAESEPHRIPNDRNWVALHIFDSIYTLGLEETFPEMMSSFETVSQIYTKRKMFRDLREKFGMSRGKFGDRSREGHYTVWIHFSDSFLKNHPEAIAGIDPALFMYKGHSNRKTDVFTGWGGQVNLAALFKEGVKGLAVTIVDSNGHKNGNFGNIEEVSRMGEADYAGGWYLDDNQVTQILTSFNTYPGIEKGYSFLRPVEESYNPAFEPKSAHLTNGYNCGDFAYYALVAAGVLTRDQVDSFKVHFLYPKKYYAQPVPLKGVGQRGADWLRAHPDASTVPDDVLAGIAWYDLLFGRRGIEFFNKKKIVQEFFADHLALEEARIWDQTKAIEWLRRNTEFTSKGIITELLPAVFNDAAITRPERMIPETRSNHFKSSKTYQYLAQWGQYYQDIKADDAGIFGKKGEKFRKLYDSLKPTE